MLCGCALLGEIRAEGKKLYVFFKLNSLLPNYCRQVNLSRESICKKLSRQAIQAIKL